MKISLETRKRRLYVGAVCAFSILVAGVMPASAVTDTATVAVQPVQQKPAAARPRAKVSALPGAQVNGSSPTTAAKPAAKAAAPGPYYVDFRARTAASYGHAFTWFGKSSERAVDVAGLHPATDSVVPYIMGHVMWVKAETGASYGDLDEQYLTANYRVYLSEEDAQKVFAYIRELQATTPFWNATTTNCTWFIGKIATFMGLKIPPNIYLPEEWVNEVKKMNGGREIAQLPPGK